MILKSNGKEIATDVDFACSLPKQIKGLMFSRRIPEDYALVFVIKRMQKISLHMLFVNYPIDAIFLDQDKRIIDIFSLKPWIGHCCCRKKVKYVIETSHGKAAKMKLKIGEKLDFENQCH